MSPQAVSVCLHRMEYGVRVWGCQENDQTLQEYPHVPDFAFWIARPFIDPVPSFRSPQSKYWHHGVKAGMGVLGYRTALSAGPASLPAQPHSESSGVPRGSGRGMPAPSSEV